MGATEVLLDNNRRYAADFDQSGKPMPPARRVAVLTCMDARLHPERFLGLDGGDAHVVRNADVEAEETLRMEPGVHAGQDSNPAGRRHRLARLIEVGGVAAVVVEQDLSGAHDGSFYPFEWLAWWLAI